MVNIQNKVCILPRSHKQKDNQILVFSSLSSAH